MENESKRVIFGGIQKERKGVFKMERDMPQAWPYFYLNTLHESKIIEDNGQFKHVFI